MRQWPWLSKIEPPLKGCKFAPKSSSSCPSPGSSPLTSLHHHPHKYINKCLALQRFCSNYWFASKKQLNHTSFPSYVVERQLETRQSFDPTIWPIYALHLEVDYTTHTVCDTRQKSFPNQRDKDQGKMCLINQMHAAIAFYSKDYFPPSFSTLP